MPKLSACGGLGSAPQTPCVPFLSPHRFCKVPVACRSKTCPVRLPWNKRLFKWRTKAGIIKYLGSISWCLQCCRLGVRMQLPCAAHIAHHTLQVLLWCQWASGTGCCSVPGLWKQSLGCGWKLQSTKVLIALDLTFVTGSQLLVFLL